jgi:two-component system OmpR family sensor kinase
VGWLPWILVGLSCAALAVTLLVLNRTRARLRACRDELTELRRHPAVVSHEIRTPLALVRGAAELLEEGTPGPLTPVQERFVGTISDNTQIVIDMAENMLTAAKFDSGTLRPGSDLVDLRAVVSTCAREIRRILGTPIHVEASGGMLPVLADENLIRQLVWNLVNNAARHAGDSATVFVTVREDPAGGCTLVVSDNGQGMDAEERRRLFSPFATGHGSRPGTGLGMMVVKRIAETYGGRVLVETDQGIGTSVVVVLPMRAQEAMA